MAGALHAGGGGRGARGGAAAPLILRRRPHARPRRAAGEPNGPTGVLACRLPAGGGGGSAAGVWGRRIGRLAGSGVGGVEALGFFELVFEDDDAAGRLDGGALVDEFAGAGGDTQLVAGVAAVTARGTQRGDEAGFTD